MVELLERPPKSPTKSIKNEQVVQGSHDAFVKQAFTVPRVIEEFIATYLPKELQDKIDPKTAKLCPSEHYSNILGKGITDLLFKVKCDDGDGYISLLIEVQSTIDRNITHRVQQYMLRICEDHLREKPRAKIPPVYPVLIYSGNRNYTAPKSFYELFTDPVLAKQAFTQDLQLINLQEIQDQELQQQMYLGACFMLLKHKLNHTVLKMLKQLEPSLRLVANEHFQYLQDMLYYLYNNLAKSKFSQVNNYLVNEIVPSERRDEMQTIADMLRMEGMEQGMQQGMVQGIEKGIMQGAVKGAYEKSIQTATAMLQEGLDIDLIARITGLSKAEILEL